jgi:hypothetical protein
MQLVKLEWPQAPAMIVFPTVRSAALISARRFSIRREYGRDDLMVTVYATVQ